MEDVLDLILPASLSSSTSFSLITSLVLVIHALPFLIVSNFNAVLNVALQEL